VKRRRRRDPLTVLDMLVDEGIVNAKEAAALRAMLKRNAGDDEPLTDAEILHLATLHHAVMQPARADGRLAVERARAMSVERAYYESLGLSDYTSRTAKLWGVTARTVTANAREFPFSMPPDKRRSPAIRKILETDRKRLKKPARRVGRR